MNEFYFKSRKISPFYLNKDSVCIAFDGLKYIRVQIKNCINTQQVNCFNLFII